LFSHKRRLYRRIESWDYSYYPKHYSIFNYKLIDCKAKYMRAVLCNVKHGKNAVAVIVTIKEIKFHRVSFPTILIISS
jgi:TPP-dependent 2-oxoacid decarboxylase